MKQANNMRQYCEDCGCRIGSDGICSNCQEELYIITHQAEYIDQPLSEEFQMKAAEQNAELGRVKTINMLTPRKYLSFSQMTTFEMSPEKYAEQYLYGKKQRISRNMQYGAMLADGLEAEEATGDPLLDLMASRLPKFTRMDLAVEDTKGIKVVYYRGKKKFKARVPVLKNKSGDIPLLALPDTAKTGYTAFKEYKTSVRPWTQRMADESGQITFYATAIWIATGRIPADIELVNVPVDYEEDGKLAPTGELVRLPTKRTLVDVIKMTGRIRKAWAGIKELCDSELF